MDRNGVGIDGHDRVSWGYALLAIAAPGLLAIVMYYGLRIL